MRMKAGIVCASCFIVASAASAESTGRFVIASNGLAPQTTIHCVNAESEVEKYATEELCRCVSAMTGVELPVKIGGERPAGRVVELSSERFADDGFELVVDGDVLHVRGGHRAGVLYGVYELLESYGGCGWFASDVEVIPKRDSIAVPATLRDRQVPDFMMRHVAPFDIRQNPVFAARLRINGHASNMGKDPRLGGVSDYLFCPKLPNCHTFQYLLPSKRYFKSHPEYFAEVDGRRRKDGQPCLSNPEVVKIITDKVLEIVKQNPQYKYFGISQDDHSVYCQCTKCKVVDDEEGSPSGLIVRLVNHVAEKVEEIRPDAVVETLAYSYSVKPPVKTRLRKNVMPCICSMAVDSHVPIPESGYERNRQFVEYLKGWGDISSVLLVWSYVVNFRHYPHPFPNARALGGDIRFFKENGVSHVMAQSSADGPHSDFVELKAYLLSKFFWKCDQPLEPLLDRFFAAYYGAGAPFARAWFDEIHDLAEKKYGADHPLWIYERICDPTIPDDVYDHGAEFWQKACEATKDSPRHHRAARWGLFGLQLTRFMRGMRGPRCADYVCTLHPERVDATRREELKKMAREFIVPMLDEKPTVSLCEQPNMSKRLHREMRELSSGGSPSVVSNVIVMEHDRINPSAYSADKRRVADPQAVKGRAVAYPANGWNFTPLDWVGSDLDGRYRLRAHIRVERADGAKDDDEAFMLYIRRDQCKVVPPVKNSVKFKDVGEGYAWYSFGEDFTPHAGDDFDVKPGTFADGVTPTCKVFLDRVEWTAVE